MGSMIDEITRQKVEEAIAKGRTEGRAEGRAEGINIGQLNLIQKITDSLKRGQSYTSEDILHLLLKLQVAN